jgi:hypothetical protein
MNRKLVVGLLSAAVLALALPVAALGAPSSRRAQLTNVTGGNYDCTAGANKGGAHEGSVTFAPDAGAIGSLDLTIVVRHAQPNSTYHIYLTSVPHDCSSNTGQTLTTDARGDGTTTVVANGWGDSTFWVLLQDTAIFPPDELATQAVTF